MQMRKTALGASIVFCLSVITRGWYLVWSQASALPLRWLPYQNNWRALDFAHGTNPIRHADAWSSFYVIQGGVYKLFELLGIAETHWILGFTVIQLIAGSLGVVAVFLLASRFVRPLFATGVALLTAIYYPSIYLSTLPLSETIFFAFLAWGVWALLQRKNLWMIATSALLLGAAVATRSVLLAFVPVAVGYVWLQYRGSLVNKTLLAVLFSLILALPVVLIAYTNSLYAHHGKVQLSASIGPNLVLNHCHLKKIQYTYNGEQFWFSPPDYWNSVRQERVYERPFYDTAFYAQEALDCIMESPQVLIENLTNVQRVFFSVLYPYPAAGQLPHYADLMSISRQVLIFCLSLSTAGVLYMLYLCILSPSSCIRLTQQKREFLVLLLLLGSLLGSVWAANPGEERYLVPYIWIIFISTAVVLQRLVDRNLFDG